jgi:tetratricopeptide (TPR) repeat protein
MMLDWFNVREARAVGVALADRVARQTTLGSSAPGKQQSRAAGSLQDLLRRQAPELDALRLNFLKRAKLANSFRWRLIEQGVEKPLAEDLTQTLLMHLLLQRGAPSTVVTGTAAVPAAVREHEPAHKGSTGQLLQQGNERFARADYAGALDAYESMLSAWPRNPEALNNVGAALCKLDRLREAEDHLRRALKQRPNYPEALFNLGVVQHGMGVYPDAESSLRRALKLRPSYVEARTLLGVALTFQGRPDQGIAQLLKVLKLAPRHTDALNGMAQATTMLGRFEEASTWFKRALESSPGSPSALAGFVGIRRMSSADAAWLQEARQALTGSISATERAALHFAMGKYHDDLREFDAAFRSYREANELMKRRSEAYRADAHASFVDDLIRAHPATALSDCAPHGSPSERPVLVVGMLRSGTTLLEQIIASHPEAAGAGELGFWSNAGRKYEAELRQGPLDQATRSKLAEAYLRELMTHSAIAQRVVDKAPLNSDYLGLIHSVFPRARIIYVGRNPIDACLSCYFQQFSQAFNFTLDLADLAHYYRQHHRLMMHWRSVLPPASLLEVRYEDLIADPSTEIRKVLDFIGLKWDERCLDFSSTERVVATASSWQVRQKIYPGSVARWRNYKKHLGPLLDLAELGA